MYTIRISQHTLTWESESKFSAGVNYIYWLTGVMLLVYAHRPLDTKFLLILYTAEAVWYFPQAPNGTIMMVELSSEPYCKAYKHEHIQRKSLSCKHQVNVSKNFSKGLQSELDFFPLTSLPIVQNKTTTKQVPFWPVEWWCQLPLLGRHTCWWHHRFPGHSAGSWCRLWSESGTSRLHVWPDHRDKDTS